jgi:ASC-1-like (ASCH) protein
MYKVHELKILNEYFIHVKSGLKTFELRKNDRDFIAGDVVVLKEIDEEKQSFTGRIISKNITYVLHGGVYGLEKDYCIIGLS